MKPLSCLLVLALALCLVQARPKRFKYSQEQDSSNEDSEENDAVTKARFAKATCGYASCPVPVEGVINVHLVPHTHDDVGWLKTVDQYFYGSNTRTQSAGVQYILDSVVEALIKDPTRRFVYVETAFFWLWWEQQNDQRRHHVRRLVDEGRLEFAGGAWTMNDEATTHYQSIVDQFAWGLRKLNDTFGECGRPRVGWQIDPFGHSREQANIFSGLGFDGLLLGRDDFQDKINRMGNKQAEMIWRGSDDIGQSSDLFTGIMFNTYAPPPGFCFDVLCSDDPIIDDKRSPDYNVDAMVERFVGRFIRAQTQAYRTNNVIVTMGGDFTYMQAEMWYKNMDKLIKYTNANEPRVKLFYSTPSCYVKAVHDANIKWPTKQDDFFPYASDAHSFWTGYFSSRPTLKYFERSANNFLQVSKQLYAMTNLNEKDKVDLNMLRSAMGVMQHHDAITGTEKQHVANDYARRLDEGVQDCLITTREALNDLMSRTSAKSRNKKSSRAAPYMPVTMCQLNITQCATTEGSNSFVVTLYNPLGHIVSHYTRVPVSGDSYVVRDPQGSLVPTQMVTISNGTSFQILDRNSTAGAELIFLAANLPPLGYRSYYVSSGSSRDIAIENPEDDDVQIEEDYGRSDKREVHIIERLSGVDEEDLTTKLKKAIAEEYSIGNEHLRLSVDSETGYISSIFVAQYNTTIPLTQEFLYYEGESGNNAVAANRSSGAYIFRPKPGAPKSISTKPDNRVYKGELVEELHQQFSDWATQVVRVYKGQRYAEFEWLVGPIPVDDKIGKEVISRFSSNLKSAGTFYTDSNGRQLLKRVINFRPTWELTLEEPVAGNYYPVTSAIAVRDQDSGLEMSILTDRAQGGSSLADGQVELMVHRRLLFDDAFGVGEALDEKDGERGLVAKGRHFLHIGKNEDKGSVVRRQLILAKQLEPTAFFTQASNLTFQQWQGANNEFSGLNTELPANVHLLTVEPWKDGTILIRLEHFLSKTDDPEELSKPVTLNVQRLFSGMDIETIRETTLGGNQYLEDSDTLKWEAETFDNSVDIVPIKKQSKPLVDDKVLDQIDGIKALVEENRSIIENMQRTVEKMQKEREGLDYYPSGSASIEEIKPKVERKKKTVKKHKNMYDEQSMEITLEPMQIRTFLVTAKFLE